jgi:predicted HTH domain antitoxin
MSFDLPDDLLQDLGGDAGKAVREILLAAAMHWCRRSEMSTSKAARLAGLTYAAFLEAAAEREVDLYDYDIEEINSEIAHLARVSVKSEDSSQDVARAQSACR